MPTHPGHNQNPFSSRKANLSQLPKKCARRDPRTLFIIPRTIGGTGSRFPALNAMESGPHSRHATDMKACKRSRGRFQDWSFVQERSRNCAARRPNGRERPPNIYASKLVAHSEAHAAILSQTKCRRVVEVRLNRAG
jgi:hypothetical protein